jgi:hypothetical protein
MVEVGVRRVIISFIFNFRPDLKNMRRTQHSASQVAQPQQAQPPIDLSVVLVTGGYDHEIRFWEAWSGICSRTIARTGESGVRLSFPLSALIFKFAL